MKKPVPPSNFQTKDFLTRVDLDRLRRGFQELLDWIDKNKGTAVDLSAYGTIASNDGRYLLRAAHDFSSFTHASSPNTGDLVLLENSSTGVKEYAALSEIATAIGVGPSGNFYQKRPGDALADSDDFTVDTVASGVWALWNNTDSAAMTTRVGDVTPFSNTLTGTQYRSTVKGSILLLQIPYGKIVHMAKACTANKLYAARFVNTINVMALASTAGGPLRYGIKVGAKSGSTFASTTFQEVRSISDSGSAGFQRRTAGGTNSDPLTLTNVPMVNSGTWGGGFPDVFAYDLTLSGAQGGRGMLVESASGNTMRFTSRALTADGSWSGFELLCATSSGTPDPICTIFAIDYFWVLPGTSWFFG